MAGKHTLFTASFFIASRSTDADEQLSNLLALLGQPSVVG
jgi:hypothetical protein